MDTVTDERERRHAVRKDVLLVPLDVKNAFRSFEQDFRIPGYLRNVLKDYLRDRSLL